MGRVHLDADDTGVRARRAAPTRSRPGSRRARRTRRRAAHRRAARCRRPAWCRRPRRREAADDLDAEPFVDRHRGQVGCHGVTLRSGHGSRSVPAAPRRSLPGVPSLLRAAGRELLDRHRPADQRGLRLHVDADQRAARRAADAPRCRLRRVAHHVPQRAVSRLQGEPQRRRRTSSRARSASSRRSCRRCRSPSSRSTGTRPTTSSRRSAPRRRPATSTWRSSPATGTPSSWSSDRVTVLYPRKGVSDLARMTPAAVEEKYGLTPAQYPDFAALRGDPSDNLPGIPGVGEKTATKWIREYGSFEQLVARADEVKGKVGDALAVKPRAGHHQPAADRAGEGCAARPAPRRPRRVDWDREQVHQVFDALEFRILRDRLAQTLQNDERAGRGRTRARGPDPDVRRPGAVARQSRRRVGRSGRRGPMGLAASASSRRWASQRPTGLSAAISLDGLEP